LFADPVVRIHILHIQRWPKRDIDLRDITTTVSSREASVTEENGAGIPANEFLKMVKGSQ
jgi:hypothetical protein